RLARTGLREHAVHRAVRRGAEVVDPNTVLPLEDLSDHVKDVGLNRSVDNDAAFAFRWAHQISLTLDRGHREHEQHEAGDPAQESSRYRVTHRDPPQRSGGSPLFSAPHVFSLGRMVPYSPINVRGTNNSSSARGRRSSRCSTRYCTRVVSTWRFASRP